VLTPEDLEEAGAGVESLEGIAGFLGGLEAGAIMVVYGFKDGTIKGSLRSTRPEINVARLAQGLGGGGHRQAAGFTLRGRLERTGKGWRAVL
jgi:phosphoesterase RecJ-like protein